jgi:alpha-ketoglutaric semialdehyde dehydrogenase
MVVDEQRRIRSTDPFRPDDVVVEVDSWGPDQVAAGIERGRAAQAAWQATPAPARAQALSAAADAVAGAAPELSDLVIKEVGKPRAEAPGEVQRAISILRYYAQQVLDPDGETYPASDGNSLLMARRRPRGLVALITPWNFPIAIPLWKAAPALAYGNAVLLKPAREAIGVALRFQELIAPHLPDGLLQIVPGDATIAQALIRASDAVSFTGSTEAGRHVARSATEAGIPAQCEMGGQNASIVLPDADRQRAAAQIAGAAMGYAGQKCTATSRVIVAGEDGGFTEALRAAVAALPQGDPGETGVQVGPVINEGARQAVIEAAREARAEGGRVLFGGEAGEGPGWMVAPTLVSGLPAEASLNQREVFGPIAAIIQASDDDDAVAIANGVSQGLVTSVYTSDLARAFRATDRLDTGLIRVNAPTSGVDFYAPFGGEKASSYGPREQGKAAREFYTSVRTLTFTP